MGSYRIAWNIIKYGVVMTYIPNSITEKIIDMVWHQYTSVSA